MRRPTGPDMPQEQPIRYVKTLETLGFFSLDHHPLNIKLEKPVAVATLLTMLVAACGKSADQKLISDLHGENDTLKARITTLSDTKEGAEKESERIKAQLESCRADLLNAQRGDTGDSDAASVDDAELSPETKAELERERAIEEKNKAIKDKVKQAVDDVANRVAGIDIELLTEIFTAILSEPYNSELKPGQEIDSYILESLGFDYDMKKKMLETIGEAPIDDIINSCMAVIGALPGELKIKLAKRIPKIASTVSKAMKEWTKYRAILDHHNDWVRAHSRDSEQDLDDYTDPCGNPLLHMEYEGANSIDRTPLDPQTKRPIFDRDVSEYFGGRDKATIKGRFIPKFGENHALVRAINDIIEYFDLKKLERLISDVKTRALAQTRVKH